MSSLSTSQTDLLVVGDLNYDYLGNIALFPRPDEEVEVTGLAAYLGGSGANASVVARRLGASVNFYSAVGDDPGAEPLVSLLESSGVSGAHVKRVSGQASGMVFGVIGPNGARNLFSFRGANLALAPEDLPDAVISQSRRLHLNGPEYRLALDLLRRARGLGIPTSLDPGSILIAEHREELAGLLANTDVLFVNETEFAWLAEGETDALRAEYLHGLGVVWVVVKMGPAGSVLYMPGRLPLTAKAYDIQAVDTTGAGDAFNAGFLYALLHDFDVRRVLQFGNAVGALAASAFGATSGVPEGSDQVLLFMDKTPLRSR